ncbi:hypothetical protein UES1_143 [Escherichia phage UE-S1]|nr:hypothetical protein UES1_143 [Escherichia phage UE-S1]
MRAYNKICIFVFLVCAFNSFGYYCVENNISYGLNPLWFSIANVVQIGIAVMSALMFCPIVTIDSEYEKLGFLRDTGDEPYNRLIVLYPFLMMLGINIQLGATTNSITSAAIAVFAFTFLTIHRSISHWYIAKMAEEGTQNT